MTASGDEPRDRRSPRDVRWLREMTDRVPTAWLPGILTAVFLGAAAAFGGLEAVAAPPLATLQPGEEHRNDMLSITVERAVLIDALPDAGVYADPEKGQRVVAAVVRAENVWDTALPGGTSSTTPTGLAGSLIAANLDGRAPDGVARLDDATTSVWLQPGVPAELVVAWVIDGDELSADDVLELEIRDFTLREGALILEGRWWDTPIVVATMDVPLTDVGAGADQPPAEESE